MSSIRTSSLGLRTHNMGQPKPTTRQGTPQGAAKSMHTEANPMAVGAGVYSNLMLAADLQLSL
eukprot:1505766-Pleurochrysis_carterae.AAC.1